MPRVLVVDDSVSVRKVVERALEARRIDVVTAASGSEALAELETEAPDLVVCDVIMPDMDGYQVCEFVKSHPRLASTPVLLISGIVNSTVLERAARVGSADVLRKPFAAEELLSKVDGLLLGRSPAGRGAEPAPRRPAPEAPRPAPAADWQEAGVGGGPAGPTDLKGELAKLAALPGVSLTVLVDQNGFLIEAAGELLLEAEMAGALAAALAEAGAGMGRELGQGGLGSIILEYDGGVLLLTGVAPGALLGMVLRDPAVLGKARYYVKKALPELGRAL